MIKFVRDCHDIAEMLLKVGTAYPSQDRSSLSLPVLGVAHLFSFLGYVRVLFCFVFVFVCLHPSSCVPNVARVYGLPLRFSLTFIQDNSVLYNSAVCTVKCEDWYLITCGRHFNDRII